LESDFQAKLWSKYQAQYPYAKETSFKEVVISVKSLLEKINSLGVE